MSSTSFQELAASPSGSNEQECGPSPSVKLSDSSALCSASTGLPSPALQISDGSFGNNSQPVNPMELTLFAAASPVSHSAPPLEDDGLRPTSGLTCFTSSGPQDPASSSLRMSRKRQSPTRLEISIETAIERTTVVYQGLMQGQTISEIVGGSLHTPTCKANFTAPSMQKWPSCRNFVLAFGGRKITPEQFEFLMGLPIGWTELEPSETPSSRRYRKPSGAPS